MLKEKFAKNLKALRKSKHLTQEQLAESVNVDFRYISLLENAKSFPSCDLIERIVNALQITYSDLFDFENELSRCDMEKIIINSLEKIDDKDIKIIYNLIKQLY